MSRSQRLLQLLQVLRRHRYPVKGADLANELGISLRSLYRDIATLQEQGAKINGEAGLGYVLQPGFSLPPLMFSEEEIEAIVLGSRWVAERGDTHLAAAARDALAKIAAVLPADLRHDLDSNALLIGPGETLNKNDEQLSQIRRAIRTEHKLDIAYLDQHGKRSQRIIWPCALTFFDRVRVIVAWCELRQEFRHFRTDRIAGLCIMEQRLPRRRQALLKEWRILEGVQAQ
ncbi:YafY family transcriptional regulator [Undibacterium sp. Jales W-56]|uniref:helix-turn-helix transcriptional regulator n=1 Tax=Undibacterium sp. Jales W-56 TaxID=2897325 RepID=UPI0021D3DDBC|nr:YafY family protein [Undibacterium sp. Jales W-56]MCU6434668.1 YafY family transcriptional regulator [Undibacterium sp. Jales W-56]